MRRYVVQAASSNESGSNRSRDKLNEFFEKMAPEIHSRPEWRDWFGKIRCTGPLGCAVSFVLFTS